jgi:HAAS
MTAAQPVTAAQPGLDPDAERVLDDYLAALAARLAGPARARQAILDELHDGLVGATHTRQAAGASQASAAAAAVAEFGDPAAVAAAFTPELAARRARRVALTLIGTGPLVGSLWLAVLAAGGQAAIAAAPVWQWPVVQAGGWTARLLLAIVGATVLAAWVTVAATGRLTRWLPARPSLPAVAAAAAASGASLFDLSLLLVLATQTLPTPAAAPWPLVTVAAIASLVRCALAGRAARGCLTLRPSSG